MIIDVDEASYGYSIVEIELLVDRPEEVNAAKERITSLANDLGLDTSAFAKVTRGKLDEYLARFVDMVGEESDDVKGRNGLKRNRFNT